MNDSLSIKEFKVPLNDFKIHVYLKLYLKSL